jgi:predicted nucleotidyltransferase
MTATGTCGEVTDNGWQAAILQDVKNILVNRPWSQELLLRGSLARGSGDAQSDVDLVVIIAEGEFDKGVTDLACTLPRSLPGRLPPWFDTLVRDFGGVGLVYLLEIGEENWGELDLYVLPESCRCRLIEHERARSLWRRCSPPDRFDAVSANVGAARQHYGKLAISDPLQAVLACYLAIFLLRKRLLRGNRLQIFADTYAAALPVRDLIILTCYPDRPEHGWYGLEKVIERSSAPSLISKVLSRFTQYDVLDPTGLAGRVAGLEELVALLAPLAWREHAESLRGLGAYISNAKHHT